MTDAELIERLRMEAQIHAQEARTANATIAEIYQLCSGGKGEPVRALIAERDALAATLRQQAGRVDADVSEQVRRLREFVAESPEHYFGIGTCKIIGSHDRNYSVRDNLLYMIDRISEAALAQNTQGDGEPVVGYITADNLALLKQDNGSAFGHMTAPIYSRARSEREIPLYLHAERARVPEAEHREWRSALTLAAETLEVEQEHMTDGGHDGDARRMKRAATVIRSMLAAVPSQRAEVK